MEHASQSDITGISMGHDLTSLLPMEWAQFMDDDMQDIFCKSTSRIDFKLLATRATLSMPHAIYTKSQPDHLVL